MSIKEDWFRRKGLKDELAERLASVFAREYSVASQDIGFAATNISVRTTDDGGQRSDCIAVFDQTYGSLRLTERLYLSFGHLLERLYAGCEAECQPQELLESVRSFQTWFAGLAVAEPASVQQREGVEFSKYRTVFRPGSRVCLREKGQLATEVEVITATMMDGELKYQVKASPRYPTSAPVKRWVSASYVEASADSTEWEYGTWDTESEEYVDGPATS